MRNWIVADPRLSRCDGRRRPEQRPSCLQSMISCCSAIGSEADAQRTCSHLRRRTRTGTTLLWFLRDLPDDGCSERPVSNHFGCASERASATLVRSDATEIQVHVSARPRMTSSKLARALESLGFYQTQFAYLLDVRPIPYSDGVGLEESLLGIFPSSSACYWHSRRQRCNPVCKRRPHHRCRQQDRD